MLAPVVFELPEEIYPPALHALFIRDCTIGLTANPNPHDFRELKYIQIAPQAATLSDSAFFRAMGTLRR